MTNEQAQQEVQRRIAQQIGQMVIDQIAAGVERDRLAAQINDMKKETKDE